MNARYHYSSKNIITRWEPLLSPSQLAFEILHWILQTFMRALSTDALHPLSHYLDTCTYFHKRLFRYASMTKEVGRSRHSFHHMLCYSHFTAWHMGPKNSYFLLHIIHYWKWGLMDKFIRQQDKSAIWGLPANSGSCQTEDIPLKASSVKHRT
jgi:hypothetical protein